jgi:putative inorganic carbon (HCO3(-)) transporter
MAAVKGRTVALAAVPMLGAAGIGIGLAAGVPLVAAAGLVPLLVAVFARPERATLLFAVGFYINAPVVAVSAIGLPPGAAGAFVVLLAVPVVLTVLVGRQPLVVTPALALMIAWLVVLVFSSIAAAGTGADGRSAIETFLTEGLLLFLLVVNAVRTPAMMRGVIWGLLLAGGLMGTISLYQELTHTYGQSLMGFAQVNDMGFKVGETLQGKVLRPRLAGPIGEQNRYAQILLLLVPLAVWCMRVERDRRLRWLAAAFAGLILCGMVLSFSRGAAVALALLVVAMVLTGFVALRHVVAVGLAVAVMVAALAPDYLVRVESLGAADTATAQDGEADAAIRGRATENLAALATFRDHPLLGVGPGGFFRRYSQEEANKLDLRFLGKNRRAHNMYLEIAADMGMLGLCTLLAIVAVTMVQLRRAGRFWAAAGRDDLALLGDAFFLALVAYLASAIFLQLSYQRYFWFVLALANATAWMLRRDAARAVAEPTEPQQALLGPARALPAPAAPARPLARV